MASSLPARPSTSRQPRSLADKLREIGLRSPKDLAAFDILADAVLKRLDEDDRSK